MNITRHNYEEFFLLYIDNELSATDRKAVEEFAEQNPDLKGELEMLQQSMLRPDKDIVFDNKDALLQPMVNQSGINTTNYESFFVLYADNELSNHEKAAVEDFVYRNPQFQEEFELLQQVRMEPDNSIVFANKESLYRKEKDDKVIPFAWWRWAAAAILLIIAGLFWINSNNKKTIDVATGTKNGNNNIQNATPGIKQDSKTVTPEQDQTQPQPQNMAAVEEKKQNDSQNGIQKVADNKPAVKKDQQQLAEKKVRPSMQQQEEHIAMTQKIVTDPVEETGSNPSGSALAVNRVPTRGSIETNQIPVANTAKVLIIDQATGANENADVNNDIRWASEKDKEYVLNTSINKQNSLRGFFRKASRLIAKKTNLGNGDDDGNRKGILIGGFEIAVK